jgi:uncharacterized membrane protein YqiK
MFAVEGARMPDELVLILITVGALALLIFGVLIIVAKFYRQVEQGKALIVNTMKSKDPIVVFTGAVVYPIINKAEIMDISVKTIAIDRRGKDGLICSDNIRADIEVTFFVRVNKTEDDVRKVAQTIGCARASDQGVIQQLFAAKFSEALKTVGKGMNFEDLYKERLVFREEIMKVISADLNGFHLDDCAIDYLEQTPIASLDKDNIMDAEGIRKITDLTVTQNIHTNNLRQKERMELGSANLASDEAIFRFDQRRAEADAKKHKDIAVAQAREQNEAQRVAEKEQKETLLLRAKNEEEALVANENKDRAVQVARQNKEREIAVEIERVKKAQQLESLSREREVELQRISKDKDVEVKKKEIADVVRARIVVDKTVAEEEERIKDVRVIAEANRLKESVRIQAEAQAQESLVKEVKAAEASEEAAKFRAREKIVTADADLEASEKQARAKIRMAEGVQAEQAAVGLAQVRVREADAGAIEKQGLVEARIQLEKMQAEALGEEKQGLARVKVREAEADAIQKKGLAEALVTKERMLAEAVGDEQKGLALVKVREADAAAIEKLGGAEARSTEAKLLAEAKGITEKAAAMKNLDVAGRNHEEFRIELQARTAIARETLEARRLIAAEQAKVLAQAFEDAKIQIVGGDGQFFDRFVKAMSLGQAFDTTLESSATLRGLVGELGAGNDGERATISGLIGKLMGRVDGASRTKLGALAERAKELGIDELERTDG